MDRKKKKSGREIPDELVREILLKLPAKSLLRFRCLSKYWRALIDSSRFIRQHCLESMRRLKTGSGSCCDIMFQNNGRIYLVEVDALENYRRPRPLRPKAIELNCPGTGNFNIDLVGSWRGIICFRKTSKNHESYILWNPSTREHCEIGVSKSEFLGFFGRTNSFWCYDDINDDFKLVKLRKYYSSVSDGEVAIFSLRSRSWKLIKKFPYRTCVISNCLVCMDGYIHFIVGRYEYVDFIVAFHLASESFSRLDFPVPADEAIHRDNSRLGCLGDRLCFQRWNRSVHAWVVWIMKDHGIENSWMKLFSTARELACGFIPLVYSKSGREVIVANHNKFRWCDLKEKLLVRDIEIWCSRGDPRKSQSSFLHMALVFPTTLVSLE